MMANVGRRAAIARPPQVKFACRTPALKMIRARADAAILRVEHGWTEERDALAGVQWRFPMKKMARPVGVEPTTPGSGGRCSIH
jgi:hypothetical protein